MKRKQVKVLLHYCKQIITSLSLLVGTTVVTCISDIFPVAIHLYMKVKMDELVAYLTLSRPGTFSGAYILINS